MKKKVLIIDDDHSLLRLSQMILTQKGYETAIAASSMEAKKMLQDDSFDIIILDLMMPHESGETFLKWLEEQEDDIKTTPVLLNTAKTLSVEEQKFFSTKCHNIISKGINFTENLLSEIQSALA